MIGQKYGTITLFVVLAMILSGCAFVDTFEDRAISINKTADQYSKDAMLLNIVRASKSEPISFLQLTSATGHNTLTGSEALPSLTVGPHRTAAQKVFVFGPPSLTRTNSNDFQMSVMSDATTQAGLMTPVDPATFGFFTTQGFDRPVLLMLFIDNIKIKSKNGLTTLVSRTPEISGTAGTDYDLDLDNSTDSKEFKLFNDEINKLIDDNFRVFVDSEVSPLLSSPGLRGLSYQTCEARFQNGGSHFDCADDASAQSLSKRSSVGPQNTPAATQITSLNCDKSKPSPCIGLDINVNNLGNSENSKQKTKNISYFWSIPLNVDNRGVVITLRSPYLIYQYLGAIVADKEMGQQVDISLHADRPDIYPPAPDENKKAFFVVEHRNKDCFAHVLYKGKDWCVPNDQENSKQIFEILTQLLAINTTSAPKDSGTATVRVTP